MKETRFWASVTFFIALFAIYFATTGTYSPFRSQDSALREPAAQTQQGTDTVTGTAGGSAAETTQP